MNFTWMFMLIMPVIVPFFRAHGLSMADVYRLQTIFAVAIVVLEVPSGYVSDLLTASGTFDDPLDTVSAAAVVAAGGTVAIIGGTYNEAPMTRLDSAATLTSTCRDARIE